MFEAFRAAPLGAATLVLFANAASAQTPSQTPANVDPLTVVVTANRGPTPIQRAGSAITVVGSEEISRTNPGSLVDVLRSVPGLDISEAGGPGAVSSVRIRGANSGQTLVLLDGIRINDASGPSGEFNFATLMPGLIDRIEVLRGPQSALYGSDAIGGVVNIITKRGRGPLQSFVRVEGGSYGTMSTSTGVSGSSGPWSYALGGGYQQSAGFSRYGYRIGRITSQYGRPLDNDSLQRWSGLGKFGYDPGNGVRFEFGTLTSSTFSQYDSAFGKYPDTPNLGQSRFTQVFAKAIIDQPDNRLAHSLQVYFNRTERTSRDVSYFDVGRTVSTSQSRSDFNSNRAGLEYQGDVRLDSFGKLTFGGRLESEKIETFSKAQQPVAGLRRLTQQSDQTTRSLFALWQLPVGERLDLSLGSRLDDVVDQSTFRTWRATAAFRLPEISTKLRASAGTGGKAPTLFQQFSPLFGNAGLRPEESLGYDAGFDTDLFDNRLRVSVTAFSNRFNDLIDFDTKTNRYINVARAESSGVETTAKAVLIDGWLSARGTYTYMHAKDRLTHLTLARRPEHIGQFGLIITPTTKWTIEPSVTMVSGRFSSTGERDRLAPYARVDVKSEYVLDQTWKIHGRVENITNARYQEVLNYGTTGRAYYGGLTATW
jgi:vitamin B12 transporter